MSEEGKRLPSGNPAELWMDWYEKSAKMWSDAMRGTPEGQADPWGLYRQWIESMEQARERLSNGDFTGGFGGGSNGMSEAAKRAQASVQAMMGPMSSAISPEKMNELFEAGMKSWQKSTGLGMDMMNQGPRWTQMLEQAQQNMASLDADAVMDPLTLITQWYNAANGPLSEFTKDLLEQEEFLEPSSRYLQGYARVYGIFRKNAEEYLNTLQLPTRSDVARVASLVISLEDKVDRVEEAFEDLEDSQSQPADDSEFRAIEKRMDQLDLKLDSSAPARDYATAEAVSGLEERVDRVEGKLDRLLEAVESRQNAPSQSAPSQNAPSTGSNGSGGAEVQATEAARRKAQELGVDLAEVSGTGSGGQITVEDVRKKGAS